VLLVAALGIPAVSGKAPAGEPDARVKRVCLLAWSNTDFSVAVREWVRRGLLEHTSIPLEFEEAVCGEDPERARGILAAWKREGPDLLVGVGTEASIFLKANANDLPLVFATTRNPVLEGLAQDLDRGGRRFAITCLLLDMEKILELFRRFVPGMKRLGVLFPRGRKGPLAEIQEAERALEAGNRKRDAGIVLLKGPVARPDAESAWVEALAFLVKSGTDAVWLPDDPSVEKLLPRLAEEANRAGVPLLASHPRGIRRYTVVGISPDYRRLGIRSAALCARILRDGAEPGTLRVEVLRAYHVILNLKAAQRARLRVPLDALPLADVIVDRDGW